GSVNGKNDGRNRIRERGPNISRANSSSVPFKSAMVMARSTASPSTWWNIGEWGAAAASRREDLAGPVGTNSGFLCHQLAGLDRRGVGPEQRALADVERVLHVTRRVVSRNVERLEVVVVALDLRALGHREAKPREDGDDLVVHAGQRVERALGRPAARQRQVE